ncbi:hypothetical protein MMSR116_24905 [Methylobacterium mesophilicum SR1.6/6]|uniref:Phage tail lysozyme domain-containing protein n=1 Tax=Methylobacterium mesophilicum SR1.6/6 TaxID=908290 RepID=A0A6B9FQ51_9HYPH|nr:hypothetical protein [Methylobacterium mesophilicum]QGY04783.1 hypothetical protein MMSR116_24905 [Methylobacterium mesophilicum SR1.6/6]
MADETLRMQAEVVDKFSGPLKSLRSQLLDVSRQGASHGETLAKGMGKAEAAIQSTARSATTVLNPALATVGVTGLTAGAAVAGVAMSLSKLSSNLSSLGALSRETGVAAGTLQTFGAVARKFGLEQDAVASGTKTFAGNMREFARGIGDTYQWINRQGTDAAGRKAFQDFAQDIRGTTDEGEKLRKSLTFMETIKNPVERGIFAQHLFGNSDFGRLADGHLGKLSDVWNAAKERLGPLDPKALLQAEKFEQAIADLRTSMQTIGTTIAKEVLPFASEFTQWIDGIAKDQRGDFVKGLRGGLQDIARELNAIDWKGAGASAKEMLLSTTALVQPLANDIKEIAAAIRSFNEGKYVEAFRHLDGGSGPLARRLAPLPGDEVLNKQDRLDQVKRQLENFAASEKSGTASERAREQADRLRREMEKLTEEIRALRQKSEGDAKAQKSSAEGDGPFAGARIQSAAFTGGGGFGRLPGLGRGANLPGGGSGPGYSGEAGPAGPDAGRGGGRLNGLGSGAPRLEGIGAGSAPRGDGSGTAGAARTSQMMGYAMDQLRREGVPEDKLRESAAHLVGQATMESGLDPNKVHDGGTGYGIYGARDPHGWGNYRGARRSDMVRWLEQNGYARNSAEGQMREMAHSAMSGRYPRTRSILMGGGSGNLEGDTNTITKEFEAPKFINRRSGAVRNALRADPEMPANRLSGLPRPDVSKADGEAWAARENARKAYEAQMSRNEGRLDASAGRAGIVAGPKVENNGSVTVNVQKAGPDARVTTSATGNLFRDIVQNHGRQMAKAD